MQRRKSRTDLAAMIHGGAPHPHAFKKGDERCGPTCKLSYHDPAALPDRQRATDTLVAEMLHQPEKEWQPARIHPPFVKRKDVGTGTGMNPELRILHTLGDSLIGKEFAYVVVLQEIGKFDLRNISIDGHQR